MPARAKSGPCTENAIKQGKTPTSEDMFSYMPPNARPPRRLRCRGLVGHVWFVQPVYAAMKPASALSSS
ncbi:MAG TPA: hypothetical protein VF219_22295, partial [Vicinamibacterales bacterium]